MGIHKSTEASGSVTANLGIQIVVYIDDILILGESPTLVVQHLEVLVRLLECLGFIVNKEKSITTPTQELEFLGLLVNTPSMCLRLPGHKIRHIQAEARRLQGSHQISAWLLSQFLGKLNAAAQAIFPAPLFYRHLQRDLQRSLSQGGQNYDVLLTLSQEAVGELEWWQDCLTKWNGNSLLKSQEQVLIQSDASLSGWGAVCNTVRTGGPWSVTERSMHINCLELLAATLAVKAFMKDCLGSAVLLQMDNTTAVAYVNNLGGRCPHSSQNWPSPYGCGPWRGK